MSLIEEALRKTQQQRHAQPATESAEGGRRSPEREAQGTPLPSIGSPSPRAKIERTLMIGGAVLIAGIVAWEAWVYLTPGAQPDRRVARGAGAKGAQLMQTSLSPSSPARRSLLQPSLRLSGIVGGPGEPLAIINGAIVRVGEEIAGAKVLEIGQDYARLQWREEEIVLRPGE